MSEETSEGVGVEREPAMHDVGVAHAAGTNPGRTRLKLETDDATAVPGGNGEEHSGGGPREHISLLHLQCTGGASVPESPNGTLVQCNAHSGSTERMNAVGALPGSRQVGVMDSPNAEVPNRNEDAMAI